MIEMTFPLGEKMPEEIRGIEPDCEYRVLLDGRGSEKIRHMWQYDRGQVLVFEKALPAGTEIQFDNGITKRIEGGKCVVPDSVMDIAGMHRAWLQVIDGEHETTVYRIDFNVSERDPKDEYVSADDEQTFREWIVGILEECKAAAERAAEMAEAAKEAAENAAGESDIAAARE